MALARVWLNLTQPAIAITSVESSPIGVAWLVAALASAGLLTHGGLLPAGLATLLAWMILIIGLSAFLWDGLINEHRSQPSRRSYDEAAVFTRDGRVLRIVDGFVADSCDDLHNCWALGRNGRLLLIFCWADTGVRILEPIARLPRWLRRLAIVSQLQKNGLKAGVFDSWEQIWAAVPEFSNPTPLGDTSDSS